MSAAAATAMATTDGINSDGGQTAVATAVGATVIGGGNLSESGVGGEGGGRNTSILTQGILTKKCLQINLA